MAARYRERIDVRSPAEFAIDHIPGAQSQPVLDDDERARSERCTRAIRRSPRARLAPRRRPQHRGDARGRVPRQAARLAPLVYCWRGGQRSRSLTHVLNEIGWRAVQLAGGYRAYRRNVVSLLATLPCASTIASSAGSRVPARAA
jgi:tRNA 2-selenouridine synthase